MKTTKEILYDNYDINITNEPIADCPNTKWYSEEEIRHIINMLSKEEETESVDWKFQLKYKLFGDE